MMNEEHRTKNDVEIDHSHDFVALRLHFSLLSSFSLLFLSIPSLHNVGTLYSASFTPKRVGALPGKLMLHPKVTGSPRRVGSFSLKQFGGLSEPEASLGEPRPHKT